MKNKYIILMALLVSGVMGCNKVVIEPPNTFEVTTDRSSYKLGDTVTFNFAGNPNNISFWSGEVGRVYDNRERVSANGAVNELTFNTTLANLPAGSTIGQLNNLKVLVSTNFSGIIDSASIRNADWSDITSRVKLATNATSTASGSVILSDFQQQADSVYLAYRYASTVSSPTSRARSWTISNFIFKNTFPDGTVYQHNTVTTDARLGGFRSYSYKGTSVKDSLKWSIGGALSFPVGVDDLSDEDWLISKSFKLKRLPTDYGVGIKDFSVTVPSYRYAFSRPGTYQVTFVANNASSKGYQEVIRRLIVKIDP